MNHAILAKTSIVLLGLTVVGCGSQSSAVSPSTNSPTEVNEDIAEIGFILPDVVSSIRWQKFDQPLLENACADANLSCDIRNAEGSVETMNEIADEMIDNGIGVLAFVNLDSESGASILQKAADAGVKTLDYDRLTLNGNADAYVSFDNYAVGQAQGEGIIECFEGDTEGKKIVQLHGSPTDNNATLFKEGYQDAIKDSGFDIVGEEAVPEWDSVEASNIFKRIYDSTSGDIDGVIAANDGLSQGAQTVLDGYGKSIPITGQDATPEGLRSILIGNQCMTVYKPVGVEATLAVEVAEKLLNGEKLDTESTIDTGTGEIPYFKAEITPIFRDDIAQPINDGFVEKADVCGGGFEAQCEQLGVK